MSGIVSTGIGFGENEETRGMAKRASELEREAFLCPDSCCEGGSSPPSPLLFLEDFLGSGVFDPDGIGSHFAGCEMWFHDQTPKDSNISATIESDSFICAGTPTSSLEPAAKVIQALAVTSGSEQSDVESMEMDCRLFEQSTAVTDIKRMRRMMSNRLSARRSRARKQVHLAGLQSQVHQLRGENSSLSKQLTNADQEFNEAVTNNHILKLNVEALRIKVKMTADLYTRLNLDRLVQSYAGSPQFLGPQQPCQSSPDFLPTVEFQSDDSLRTSMQAIGQFKNSGVENGGTNNADIGPGLNQSSSLQSIASIENQYNSISSNGDDIWAFIANTDSVPK